MRNVFRSFYVKLSVVFLLLLLILGITQIFLTMNSASQFIREVDQRLNFNLAQDMAGELKPLLSEELDFGKIGERIHYMMVMNPKVEIYVLDENGRILAYFAELGKKVQAKQVHLAPIRQFLNHADHVPVLGDDPRNPGRKKPFSIAPIRLGNQGNGYLYIIIGGEQYETAASMLRESYLLKTIVKGLSFSVLGAGMIGLILFALLTRRIHSLSTVVKRFQQGDFQQRIPVTSRDEIGQLAHSFNQLADAVVAKTEALRQKDDLRRELIANVSHDLRTPLASIQGYLETILIKESNGTLTSEERERYLKIILKNTEMLNRLVYELFELSKLEAKQIAPQPEPFSLAELAQDVAMKFHDQAQRKQVKLETRLQPHLPVVNADIGMIERAMSNLIENAIDYTPPEGTIRIEVQRHNSRIRTIISDSGSGIPPEEIPHIFDRFYKGKKKPSGQRNSTGLGLAIANKIIEAHGSSISVTSELNRGTTFSFDLPVA